MYNPRIVGIKSQISQQLEKDSLPPRPAILASPSVRHMLLAILCSLLVLTVYVWLVSVGTWTHWPARWYAYNSLAISFRRGQLYLNAKPSPALLALANPYDPSARQGIPFPQDASLYNGRFYLYFGPVPALILGALKIFIPGRIGDEVLVFAFASGIFLLESFLLLAIRQRFFPRSPAWTLAPVILASGLTAPIPWVLSTPSVYNAAITAGQFFFLAGFVAAFSAIHQRTFSNSRLVLAGLLWAAALGSRITQILPIAFMMIYVVVIIVLQYRRAGTPSRSIPSVLALLSGPAIGLAALGWYNWARFGSPFETGFEYALAGVPVLAYGKRIYSLLYILQNIYNYFFNVPELKQPFPYLNPTQGTIRSVLPLMPLPSIYRAQELTGLLYTAPFLVLAMLPIVGLLRRQPVSPSQGAEDAAFRWLVIGLAGSFLLSSALFLSFFWAAERYLLDFLPGLVTLSMIGMWQVDRHLSSKPRLRRLYWVLLLILVLASILVSILLSMTFNSDGFRQLNPVLWRQLSNLFRR